MAEYFSKDNRWVGYEKTKGLTGYQEENTVFFQKDGRPLASVEIPPGYKHVGWNHMDSGPEHYHRFRGPGGSPEEVFIYFTDKKDPTRVEVWQGAKYGAYGNLVDPNATLYYSTDNKKPHQSETSGVSLEVIAEVRGRSSKRGQRKSLRIDPLAT